MKFSFAQATLVLVFAVGVFAQDHPNGARGFKAESVYQTSDVDNVNLFNGNLLVTVPLGQTYHVGGNLSYSLNLVYNGQMWSYRKFLRFATAVPGSQSNVALGWQLTLGELTAPATVPRAGDNVTQYDIGEPGPWTFTSPDGASHPFIGGIHPEESRATTAPATRQVPVLGYTTDNTYMRLHGGDWELIDDQVDLKKWAVRVTVQMPTGLSYRFRSQNTIASNERPVYAPGAPTVITSRYFLESISDAFGNRVEIRYYSSPNVRDDIRPHLATIREIAEFPAGYPNSGSPQRTHRIYLENVQWFRPNIEADNHTLTRFVVKRVELQTWLGPKTYEFDTEPAAVVALPCESEHEPTKQPPDVDFQAKAHLLRAVKLPDGTSYSFTYQQPDPSLWATGGPCNPFAGHMLSLTQPTGARIDYTVGVRQFPQVLPDDNGAPAGTAFQKFFRDYHSPWYTSLAVKTRTVTSGDDLTKWTYATCKGAPMQHPNERRWQEMTVKVDGPDGRTQHYFSVDLSTDTDYPGRLSEYGLPFTRGHPFPLDPSYFLSTEILDGSCDALQTSQFCAPCDDKVVQRTYVKYELDDHIDFPLTTATETGTDFHLNSRRVGTITVRRRFDESSRKWVDDKSCGEAGNQLCFTKVEQGEYDGLGHYRTETRFTSDIPDNGNAVKSDGLTRVTRTNYDAVQVSGHTPAVYKSDPAFTNDPGRYMVPPTQERWQLDFYDKTTVQETLDGLAGTEITTARVCLDPGTGVLTRKKTIRANDTNLDAVAAFGHDAQGNLQKESYHLVPKEDPGQEGSAWCSAPLPDAEVSMSHVWSHGSLSESSYDNPFVRTLKLDIHRPTGLPERSYDAMGRATEYAYDAMGRITLVKPPSVGDAVQASSVYEYDVPGLRATVRQVDGATVLTETHHYYDALGRLIQSRRRTPDGWVTTAKKYDPMGRVATLTVPVFTDSPAFSRTFVARGASSPPPVTTFTYDRLGRAKTVLAPDNSVVRTDYVESDVRRTVRVATRHDSPSTQAAQTDVTTIETYDGFGRLVSVQEPPLRAGDPVGPVTRYLYDFGDRLTRVIAGEQERIFTYDRAGLLEEEDHPETALTKYTYDARGHALTKNIGSGVKLVYTYDGAERLTRISDGLRGKSLKDFHYDRFEQTEEKGRLIAQSRHNHFSPGQASVVTDRFTFDGVGRVKTRKTSVSHGSAPADEFVQTFDYTPLGAPSKINYPTCTTCGPNGQNARGIPLTFKDGLLTNIGGITAENAGAGSNGIAYSASGSVFKVQHGLSDGRPGVLDTFTPDALGMARLESIEFTGAIDCALITAEPADTTVDREGRAALQLRAVEGAQIQWYRGPQGTTSAPLASTDGRLLTDPLLETTEFWALVSIPGGTCKQSTRTITVKVCVPASALPQKVSHKILINAPLPLTVTADGTNLRYEWSSRLAPAGEWTLFGTQRQVEFKQGSPGRYDVIVVLTAPGCGLPLTVEIAQVDVKAPTPCDAEFRTVLDPKVTVSMPNGRRRLVAELELREGATYRFDWYEDGVFQHSDTAGNVSTYDMVIREKDKIVRVEATTTCGTETSPKVISESYGTVHGRCTAPVVEVDPPSLVFSNETVLQIGATSNRTDVTYQWYLGESGNTDMKVAEGTSPTVFVPARPETYWVRVTVAKCGAFTDSPAIPVASNRCAPVRLLRQPPDREIRAGDSTDLFVDATALPLPLGHRWYLYGERGVHQEIQGTEAGNATFRVTPLRTTDYLAVVTNGAHRLHDAACYDEASTRRARVHVTSCADINVTSQPQDRSEYPGTAVTLRIDATAVMPLRYQWYGGKSGDTQNPIAGATGPTLNATDTGDYWVRVGFDDWNLCAIDSRTAGVVFCTTPTVSGGTRKSTVAGQTHVLVADYQADRPTFAWYADVLDDESRRLPSTTEVAEVAPLATTTYYVRVSNACDALDPASAFATFKVSVCPTVIVHPFAAKTLVVRNTKTSVSLNVNGADKIEWFVHLDGADGDGTVFATGTLQTVETPPITGKTHVWARVHNGECWLDTTAVIIDVCSGPTVTWGTNPDKVTQDSRHNITAVADPATAAVDFYEGPAGDLAASVVVYSGNVYPATFHTTRKLWFRATQQGCYADSTQLTVEVCVPEIKAQPQSVMIDKTANPNATATLTVLATPSTGMLPTYQWYVGQPGVTTTPIVGQTSASLTVSPTSETAYWVRVTGCGISRDSVAATVSLCAKPEIRTQPPSRTLVSGSSTVLSVDAVGTDLTYQWYRGASGDVSSPVNSTSASLTVEPTVTTDYWVKVSGRCGTVSSATAKISVKPTITLQPAGGSVMPGSSKTLTVDASGAQLAFQWFIAPSTAVGGATGKSYTPPAPAADTSYFCRVTSGTTWTDTNTVLIDVCDPLPLAWGSLQTKVRPNVSQTLSVTGIPAGVATTTKWYEGDAGVTTKPLTSAVIQPAITTKYWGRITRSDNGCWTDVPAVRVEVCVPAITTQPAASSLLDKSTNASASVQLKVVADLGPHTYQWYIGQPGVTTTPVSGATSDTYNASPNADTTYWVRVTGTCGVATDSTAALVTLCKPPEIRTQPPSRTLVSGSTTVLSVDAVGTELTYQWYRGASGDVSSPVNSTSASLTVEPTVTTDYWVKVSGRCGTVSSATAKISVKPTITLQPAGGSVMPGSSKTLTVDASGAQLAFQWFIAPSTAIGGATGKSYTPPAPAADTSYFSRVSSGTTWTDTNTVLIDVCDPLPLAWGSLQTKVRPNVSQTLSVTGIPAGVATTTQWFEGDTGVTTKPLTSAAIQPAITTKYWGRIARSDNGCWTDLPAIRVEVCVPAITTQPAASSLLDKSTNASASVQLEVVADLGPHTYQWYIGQPGVTTTPVSGATSDIYNASPNADTTYWVRVTGTCGVAADSTAALVTLCKPPAITEHPRAETNVNANESTTLSVKATGTDLTHQWYRGNVGDVSAPVSAPLGTTTSITVSTNVTTRYWVRVTGRCGTINSTSARVSVPATITSHPAGGPITSGSSRILSVVASGVDLSYQWYKLSGTTPTVLSGQTASSFNTGPVTADSSYYCRVVSGTNGTDSNVATLTVCLPRGATSSGTQVAETAHTLSISGATAGETYEWYRGSKGDVSAPLGTGTTKSVSPSTTTLYWARIKRSGCDADGDAVTVRICYPKITSQPQGATIATNGTHTLTVAAVGPATLSYQWFRGAAGLTSSPVGTGPALNTGPLTATTTYWVRVSSPLGSGCAGNTADSVAATVTVCNGPAITTQPAHRNIETGGTASLTVTATGDHLSYQWYEGAAGVTTTPVGINDSRLTVSPSGTKSYWVRITGTCGVTDSTAAMVSVYPNFTSQPVDANICRLGDVVTFSASATGTNVTYQWYRTYSSGEHALTGETGATLSTAVTQLPASYRVAANSGFATRFSNGVTIVENTPPTVLSIGKETTTTGYTRLTANVYEEDPNGYAYAWYEGPLGNTTKLINTSPSMLVKPVPPVTYWVRVTAVTNGCSTNKAISF